MKSLIIAGLFFCGVFGFAAENNGGRGDLGRRGNMGGRGRMGQSSNMMMQNQVFAEAEIAKKYPAEYAEVEKLREQYEAKLAELAKKADVNLPVSRDAAYRKILKAYPAEFASAVEKMKTSPREGFTAMMELAKKAGVELFNRGGRGGSFGRRDGMRSDSSSSGLRSFNRPDLPALRKKYPEKMKEYDALRAKDPAKARELLMQIIQQDKSEKK